METRKIVRANGAGVFFGEVVKQDGTTVTMRNVRRLWYWDGAASLSELAQNGTANPTNCKFPCTVEEIQIFNVIEILSVTSNAAKSIDGVKVWTKF
ncbi:MAG: hypothetical protein IIZ93_05615 [Acidaminococcaceae bacterium]|nr:hypothetical protein [Acidaminococcaceae bacterium]